MPIAGDKVHWVLGPLSRAQLWPNSGMYQSFDISDPCSFPLCDQCYVRNVSKKSQLQWPTAMHKKAATTHACYRMGTTDTPLAVQCNFDPVLGKAQTNISPHPNFVCALPSSHVISVIFIYLLSIVSHCATCFCITHHSRGSLLDEFCHPGSEVKKQRNYSKLNLNRQRQLNKQANISHANSKRKMPEEANDYSETVRSAQRKLISWERAICQQMT